MVNASQKCKKCTIDENFVEVLLKKIIDNGEIRTLAPLRVID